MSMNWLLLLSPVAIGLEAFAGDHHLLIFITSSASILPLAWWMGRATEQLAERLGESIGGLLNATFGNAAELIIALTALHAGLHEVVEASIIGSIVSNMLLVFGAAMLAGGIRYPEQVFNPRGARSQASMLVLATIALILPAAFNVAAASSPTGLYRLSIAISVMLLLVYLLYLVFSLLTHPTLFHSTHVAEGDPVNPATLAAKPIASLRMAIAILAMATVGVAWMSEIMVGSIGPLMHEYSLSDIFVGAFVVAVLGNAAEHATAITAAIKNRMDLSFAIAIGSSVQVALFVAPVLILASLFIGPAPLDLAFRPALVLITILSVVITAQLASDGHANWFKGVQLLAVYVALALTVLFLPN